MRQNPHASKTRAALKGLNSSSESGSDYAANKELGFRLNWELLAATHIPSGLSLRSENESHNLGGMLTMIIGSIVISLAPYGSTNFLALRGGDHSQTSPGQLTDENITKLQTDAEAGNVSAQMKLARAYESGNGVPRDDGKPRCGIAELQNKATLKGKTR
jgi:TPR repeat protein